MRPALVGSDPADGSSGGGGGSGARGEKLPPV